MLRVEKNNNNNNAQKEDFEVLYGVTEWHWSESYLSNFKTIHKKIQFQRASQSMSEDRVILYSPFKNSTLGRVAHSRRT